MTAQPPPLKRARTGLAKSNNSSTGDQGHPTKDRSEDKKSTLQAYECSFIKWHVSGITSVAATPSGRYLAVARINGTLELRDKNRNWATVSIQYVRQTERDNTIRGMTFCNNGRFLFVAHLVGAVDIFKLTPDGISKYTTLHPGGGAIWSIAANRALKSDVRIAIASDDGRVRIISPDPSFPANDPTDCFPSDPAGYEIMVTEKTSARVLCVCWSQPSPETEASCIVCGDDEGGIRWLSASKGSSFGKGKIPSAQGQKVLIWTVQVASDGREVVCGDSRGVVTVWSSVTNTMNTEVQIEGMQGAIWSSVLFSENAVTEYALFGAAGGGIGGLKKGGRDESWTPIRAVQLHTHDVRGMCPLANGMVLSGSMDSLMRTFSITSLIRKRRIEWIHPYAECVGQQPIQFNQVNGIIMARLRRSVELWSLSKKGDNPSLLLRMNISASHGELRACALSRDCRSVAISTPDCFKLYRIWDGDCNEVTASTSFGKVVPVEFKKDLQSLIRGCVDMSFGGHFLACLTQCRKRVVLIAGDSFCLSDINDFGMEGTAISRVICTRDRVAISDTRGNVYKCDVQDGSIQNIKSINWDLVFSRHKLSMDLVTALAFSGSGKKLAICTTSRRGVVLDLQSAPREEFDYSDFGTSFAQCVSFSKSENSMLISGSDFCVICPIKASSRRKRKHHRRSGIKGVHMLPYKDSLIGSCVMGTSRIAIVRREWEQVLSCLSDAILRKVYGS